MPRFNAFGLNPKSRIAKFGLNTGDLCVAQGKFRYIGPFKRDECGECEDIQTDRHSPSE